MERKKFKTIDLAYIGLMVAVITVCAWINIPLAIPFTLQTFAIFAAVGLLGMERATVAVVVYIICGAIGVPVFAGIKGGMAVLQGATGGYIIGFIFSALATGALLKLKFRKEIWFMAIAMVIGLIVCYAFGTAWFVTIYTKNKGPIGVWAALSLCVFPYIIPDLVKIAVAILVTKRVDKYVK